MDVMEAIGNRRSIRAFKADPVPKATLQAIMEAALKAPSWGNTQPWEFAVLGGEMIEKVRAATFEKATASDTPNPDIPAPVFDRPYLDRIRSMARGLMEALGIPREDKKAGQDWMLNLSRFYGAPHLVVVSVDASLSQLSLLDVGLALENLMLAAWNLGVGTCTEAAAVQYPEVMRSFLKIPESKRIVLGVALGYPEMSSPVMKYQSVKEPSDALVTWYGFD